MVTFWAVSGPKLGGVVNLGNETQKISSTATIRNHIWWLSHAENILEIGRPPSFGPTRFSRTTTLNFLSFFFFKFHPGQSFSLPLNWPISLPRANAQHCNVWMADMWSARTDLYVYFRETFIVRDGHTTKSEQNLILSVFSLPLLLGYYSAKDR